MNVPLGSDPFVSRPSAAASAYRVRLWTGASLLATGTLLAYAGAPTPVAFAVLGVGAVISWTLPLSINVPGYLTTLGFQVFQSLVLFRVALADVFMAPAAVQAYLDQRSRREPLLPSTLLRPFAFLLAVFAIGNAVAWLEVGRLSGYVLLNKDLGILYLLAGFYTLGRYMTSRTRIEWTIRWFVIGVTAANVTALLGAALAFGGLHNDLYLIGNFRLYGWMMNPSLFGGILLTAAMIELGLLTTHSSTAATWRWLNVWLMAVGVAMTVSRGIWVAAAIGGTVLLFMQIAVLPTRAPRRRLAAIGVWVFLPLLALTNIFTLTVRSLTLQSPQAHAEELRRRLVVQCKAHPEIDVCASVQIPDATTGSSAMAQERADVDVNPTPTTTGSPPAASAAQVQWPAASVADQPVPPPSSRPEVEASVSVVAPPPVVDNALTNVRGLQDRAAILGVAAREYVASVRRLLLGIGLGTFFATSADDFGVPLIIHNTFAWFLFEMGPLGLLAVVWIWAVTVRNLWRASRSRRSAPIAVGLIAAFVSLTVFCTVNEGFYQRHLWLVFVLADRLFVLEREESTLQFELEADAVGVA